ncbi:ATP-dependent DNA helicase [Sphingopyxis macrogoltabida]|uniref:Helicase n=1 Tax=Sphingopyxis macrogoltabida TaxID=33050 RepID=A0AAC9FFT6_SPHMC|nr:ATP-dependent DNA helicase [Sphingopyxis macrogoltabida]ALJ14278.1 helicase [Sphingopyxis macrogoltabida]AMU90543.1 helicase [Sphingopyxis macrogoltabida]
MPPAPLPLPAIHASHVGIWIADAGGRVQRVGRGEAIAAVAATPHLFINATLTGDRLGYPELSGLDLLELFAFLYPARFAVPTPAGIAAAAGIAAPKAEEEIAAFLPLAAAAMLASLTDPDWPEREGAWHALQALARQRWPWTPLVQPALAAPDKADRWLFARLPEWEEVPPRAQPRQVRIAEADVAARLDRLTGDGAERRPGQQDYARATAAIFEPRDRKDAPQMLVAEAGTGIGKTLGYLAPAKQWIDQSAGAVCISTFTKALQRQLARETEKLYPDAATHREKVVVRKGRENYLCLLNLEDALQGGFSERAAILAQLVARWAAYTRDGDMIGGDLPGWLPALFRRNGTTALTDRRGECIYAGCPHFRKCFIERSARAATQADIVIANHALTMVQAARPRDAGAAATRLIFDEGHHLWDAADSMFAAALTGQEAVEIRRWVLGPEGKSRGRRRGLAARLADVASYDEAGDRAIQAAIAAAAELPGDGWLGRLGENAPWGAIEQLLAAVRGQVYARAVDTRTADSGYGLETELAEPDASLVTAAAGASDALEALLRPLMTLGKRLDALIEDPPDWLDGQARARVDGARHSLGTRIDTLGGWLSLLGRVGGPADPDFVDWLAVDRFDGREYDCGLHRHWLDPARPVAEAVYRPAQGVLVTSATLRSGSHAGANGGWAEADIRTGARHMDGPVHHFAVPSPFDYARQSEVLIVTDIARGDLPALAGAYSRLIEASGGGALGLFSAIRRLRIVHARIADRLARAGLPLYAQHVDPLDTGTLVDIFRADPHASLLGTDALRDGVDVPGDSLRLVVMEGVPWPRPTILHAARRAAQGGSVYDDMVIRGRIAQAFGRLIRRSDDFGQFVMLSPSFPSRLLGAFPEGTPIRRLPLDEVVNHVAAANVERRKSAFAAFSPS